MLTQSVTAIEAVDSVEVPGGHCLHACPSGMLPSEKYPTWHLSLLPAGPKPHPGAYRAQSLALVLPSIRVVVPVGHLQQHVEKVKQQVWEAGGKAQTDSSSGSYQHLKAPLQHTHACVHTRRHLWVLQRPHTAGPPW